MPHSLQHGPWTNRGGGWWGRQRHTQTHQCKALVPRAKVTPDTHVRRIGQQLGAHHSTPLHDQATERGVPLGLQRCWPTTDDCGDERWNRPLACPWQQRWRPGLASRRRRSTASPGWSTGQSVPPLQPLASYYLTLRVSNTTTPQREPASSHCLARRRPHRASV